MKTLIVNADDFGLARGVNAAVLDAFQAGSVSSTTLMANAPAFDEAVSLARENPGLGVGLHFNLTLGRAVDESSNLTKLTNNGGEFHSRGVLARKLLLGTISRADIVRELEAQFARLQQVGVAVTHVDSHQHVHGFPHIFDAVATFCESRSLPMRVPWILDTANRPRSLGRRGRQWVLRYLLHGNVRRWQGRLNWNQGLGSIFDLGVGSRALDSVDYRNLLDAAGTGVFELMVHPARSARELEGLTRIGHVSEREWRYLKSGALRQMIDDMGFALRHYGNAWA